jgi:hypothetical protein
MTESVEDLGPRPYASRVETMSGYGLSADDIANALDLEIEELKASYAKQLSGGQIKANARVAESLFRKAIGEGRESVTAAIFWLKTRARWKETSVHEHAARFTHDDFILQCVEERAECFTSKIEEMVARQQQGSGK